MHSERSSKIRSEWSCNSSDQQSNAWEDGNGWFSVRAGCRTGCNGWNGARRNRQRKSQDRRSDAGGYEQNSGNGSVEAAKMAAEEFGNKVNGKPIEIVAGDHQNK